MKIDNSGTIGRMPAGLILKIDCQSAYADRSPETSGVDPLTKGSLNYQHTVDQKNWQRDLKQLRFQTNVEQRFLCRFGCQEFYA